MTPQRWFFLEKNEVIGPLQKWEIELRLVNHPEGLIWGPGITEWISAVEWRKRVLLLEEVLNSLEADKKEVWCYQDDSELVGPMSYHNLIQELKKLADSSRVQIQRRPNKKMRPIYEWPTLMDEAGLSRRRHLRVPIQGYFHFKNANPTFQKKLITISEGGFSLQDALDLNEGDLKMGEIVSQFLSSPILCSAEMITHHKNGITSFRFESLTQENLKIIKTYTERFKKKT